MDNAITGLERRKNILITNLKGFDRSRFLLKTELHLLLTSPNFHDNIGKGIDGAHSSPCAKANNGFTAAPIGANTSTTNNGTNNNIEGSQQQRQQQQTSPKRSFKRIYHVVDSDELVRKIYIETSQMPFGDFNLSVAKLYSNETGNLLYHSDSRQIQCIAQLIVCHVRYLFDSGLAAKDMQIDTRDAIIVFDGIGLEKLEELCCKLRPQSRGQRQRPDSDGLSAPIDPYADQSSNKRRMIEQQQQQQQQRYPDEQIVRPSVIRMDSSGNTMATGGILGRLLHHQPSPCLSTANGTAGTMVSPETERNQRSLLNNESSSSPPSVPSSTSMPPYSYLPRYGFCQATASSWSIVLACNPPVDGLEHELGYKFECCTSLVSGHHQQQLQHTSTHNNYRIFSSIIMTGPNDSELFYITKSPYNEIARTVLECLHRMSSGKAVIMFREFKHTAEYHAKWCQAGMFDKIGYALYTDTGCSVQASRKVLIDFHRHQGNALLLTSHSFNENVSLTEYVFSSAKMMIILGLPRPAGMADDKLRERTNYSNSRYFHKYPSTALNGYDLIFYRGLETLNGTIRKYLGEYRWTDCAIFIVAPWLAQAANKLTSELADVRTEKFTEAMDRFDKFRHM